MKLLTFNLRYGTADDGPHAWPHRRQAVREFLQNLEADVMCFQEALAFQVQEIAAWLPEHAWVGVGRDDGAAAGEFAPIFFRFGPPERWGTIWLSETPEVPGSLGWGADQPRICTWARLNDLTVANVHLDHRAATARREGIKLALSRLEGPAVLCGDFNAEPGDSLFDDITKAGFQDLAPDTGETYNGFHLEPNARIDYVFGRGVRAESACVYREKMLSDHWPLIATLSRG